MSTSDDTDLSSDVEEVIYRVDERTQHIEEQVDDVATGVADNREDIDNLQGKVKRHTTVINAFTVGGVAVVTWVADKVTRLFP